MNPDTPVFTVSQISNAIKHCLEGAFSFVCLQGEISNIKLHSSGHLYFSLKDAHAQISAIMYRADALGLKGIPKDGAQVIIKGEINVYPQAGKYQIIARALQPIGVGALLQRLEELKIELHRRGWFRAEHKKALPKFPRCIGVVTSPTGAAIQDILNILTRRFSGFHLILNPVRVQGEGAAKEIAQAIAQFNQFQLVDVMIVGRGGGSIEDLWAFNEETVAHAIFHSRIPIISAVGHETDHCIADYVADVRAPTPSAAAEIVVAEKTHHLKHLDQMLHRVQQSIMHLVRQDKHRLCGIVRQPAMQSSLSVLGPWMQKLDILSDAIDHAMLRRMETLQWSLESKRRLTLSSNPSAKLQEFKKKTAVWSKNITTAMIFEMKARRTILAHLKERLEQNWKAKMRHQHLIFQKEQKYKKLDEAWHRLVSQRRGRLEEIKEKIDTVNPKNLLSKGYCILFSKKNHSAITSVHSVEKKEEVEVILLDGSLQATINEVVY